MDYFVFSDPQGWVEPTALAYAPGRRTSRLFSEQGRDNREAWVAARFAIGLSQFNRETVQVRLSKPPSPDFEVNSCKENAISQFETCEVLHPDRKRHDEFKDYDETHLRPSHRFVSVEEARQYVLESIEDKVNKQYSIRLNLLVYINLGSIPNGVLNFNMTLPTKLTSSFKSIWVFLASSIPETRAQEYSITRFSPNPMGGWFPYLIEEP